MYYTKKDEEPNYKVLIIILTLQIYNFIFKYTNL